MSELSQYMSRLESSLERLQSALAAKLETAKRNSANNATAYASLAAPFAAPSRQHQDSGDSCCKRSGILSLGDSDECNEEKSDHSQLEVDFSRMNLEKGTIVSNGLSQSETNQSEALPAVPADMSKTCLTIDTSYQESIDNLRISIAAKRKYLVSIRL